MKHLKCPTCRTKFKNVVIRDGSVRCPECDHVMFQYRREGEEMTPQEFTKLLETRGKEAAFAAMDWFKMAGMNKVESAFAAGNLIMFLWPHLAQTFVKEE